MHYVSMIDTFFSDWGPAEGKSNIYLIECDSAEQAERVADYAKTRDEMRKVRTHDVAQKPQYGSGYLVREKHINDLGPIWQGE